MALLPGIIASGRARCGEVEQGLMVVVHVGGDTRQQGGKWIEAGAGVPGMRRTQGEWVAVAGGILAWGRLQYESFISSPFSLFSFPFSLFFTF